MREASQLPDLAETYPLQAEQIESFQRDGHILLPSVCSADEIAAYRPVIVDAAERFCTESRPMEERDTYGKAFLQIMNLWTVDEAVKRFTLARRFARLAAELMSVPGVRLYHDQALFKEPGGGLTPWHQDFYYWPLQTDKTVTLWMPLVDAEEEMGTLTFASGSHKEGYLGALEISDHSEEQFKKYVQEKGYRLFHSGSMKAGDVSFHAGTTLHSAPGNKNLHTTREVMTIIYFADGTKVMEPDNKNRENDLASWLPGMQPGDTAASPLNPLVYSSKKN